jgi:hypothetical protein
MNIKTSKIYFILFIILITSCNSKGEVNTGENNSLSTEQNIDEDEINVIEEHNVFLRILIQPVNMKMELIQQQ